MVGAFRVIFGGLLYVTLYPKDSIMRIFAHWDTAYYYEIAQYWYPHNLAATWAFFPLYPAIIRILYLLGLDIQFGAFFVSATCGLICIPLFQRIAEHYYSHDRALATTLLYFFFPPVFVFLGVNYTESLFLLLSMLAWFYHLRQKEYKSLLATSLASLTKTYGVFLVVAIGYDYLRRRQFKKIAGLMIPIALVVAWNLFSLMQTGTIAVVAVRVFWQSKNPELFRQSVLGTLHGDVNSISILLGFLFRYLPIAVAASSTGLLTLFLCYKVCKLDGALALYLLSSMLVIFLNFFPGVVSISRYLSFLFPIGLPLYIRKREAWTILLVMLIILSYWGWWAFLADDFY
jgi:hypothetical protein